MPEGAMPEGAMPGNVLPGNTLPGNTLPGNALSDSMPPNTSAPAAEPSNSGVPETLREGPIQSAAQTAAQQRPAVGKSATAPSQSSLFDATRQAVQESLDRGTLSQALLLLSDWYGDPSLSAEENQELQTLLGQLAGSVIYSREHRLEPPYLVQADETLEMIAQKFNTSWQLLAKINGIERPNQLQPGQKLKVVQGPFSALIDLGDRQLTLMLDRRYAGKFPIDVDPQAALEEGHWRVDQKLVTPGNVGLNPASASALTEEESLVLTNLANPTGPVAVLCGQTSSVATTGSADRAIRIQSNGITDLYDILSVGSRVVIRR
jgi:LysM repeat protein